MPTSRTHWPRPARTNSGGSGSPMPMWTMSRSRARWRCRWRCRRLARVAPSYDALIALGCIIRGETYHFELVANESGAGVTPRRAGLPAAGGQRDPDDRKPGAGRSRARSDKGRDAARVAVEMALLMEDARMTLPDTTPQGGGLPPEAQRTPGSRPPRQSRTGADQHRRPQGRQQVRARSRCARVRVCKALYQHLVGRNMRWPTSTLFTRDLAGFSKCDVACTTTRC
jgi:hypothetical protein